MMRIICGYLMAVFTVMMWSLNIIYSKYLSGVLTPSEISFYRWIIGFAVMLPIAWHHLRENFFRLLKLWHIILLMALTGIGFQNWFIYKAGETADATTMGLISVAGPIFLIILSPEKISFMKMIGMLTAVVGVADVILRGNFANIATFQLVPGDLYMLGSGLMFAFYALVQKKIPADISRIALLTLALLVAAIIYFFPSIPELTEIHLKHIPKLSMIIIILLGILNSAFAYMSWDAAIERLGAVTAGIMYYTMPIFSIIFAYFLLGEKVYISQLFGALLIVFGVFMLLFDNSKKH